MIRLLTQDLIISHGLYVITIHKFYAPVIALNQTFDYYICFLFDYFNCFTRQPNILFFTYYYFEVTPSFRFLSL